MREICRFTSRRQDWSTAVGILELLGHGKSRALQALGLGAAIFESWEGMADRRAVGTIILIL